MSSSHDELGKELAELLGEGPSEERRAARRQRLLAQLGQQQRRRSRPIWRPLIWGLAATAAVVLAWISIDRLVAPPAMVCRTAAGQPLSEGNWVEGLAGPVSTLRFSEGSEVSLRPGGRLQLGRLDRERVDITLESGSIDSTVRSASKTTWRFHAGPYLTEVVGTQLSIAWDSDSERLTVGVAHGVVRVTGGTIDERGMAVSAGQRLTADASRRRVELVDLDATPAQGQEGDEGRQAERDAGARARERDAASAVTPSPARGGKRRHVRLEVDTRRLQALLRGQDYASIVAEAGRLELDSLVGALSGPDLLLLADAYRLDGSATTARRVLLAVRRRFGKRRDGRDAAFRLGRLAWDHQRDYTEAARWFEAYLREGPTSVLKADAEGRLMVALARSGQRRRAQSIAREYLERYPNGDYAVAARALLAGEGADR